MLSIYRNSGKRFTLTLDLHQIVSAQRCVQSGFTTVHKDSSDLLIEEAHRLHQVPHAATIGQ
jgi:hypothetical protein